MAPEYRSIEYRLHEYLVQMQEMLSILGFEQSLLDSIKDCKELIKNKQYTIAVMGEFKRGKSSLINALLGAKILPADTTPTTATINRITYGPIPKVNITFHSGKRQEIPISKLENYVTKITKDGEARASKIREATVYFPTVICQNYIDIIDTPGLNDEAKMTQIAIEMIANVDAVIIPIHARAPFSETEKIFVCQLIESDNINNLVFVVTFLDQLDEDDYEYDKFMEYIKHRIQSEVFSELEKRKSQEKVIQKAHQLLDQIQVNGISSSLALESFVSNNRELRIKSRFETFYNSLISTVTAKQLENAIRKTIETVHFVVSEFDKQNQKRKNFLEDGIRNLKYCETIFEQYCLDSPKEHETIFLNKSAILQNMISSFNANKNYIVKEFIKDLSQVRQNNHEVIRKSLIKTENRVCNEIHKRCVTLQNNIFQIFKDILHRFQKIEKERLHFVSEYPNALKMIGFNEQGKEMNSFAETILNNAVFSWDASYGKIQNLTDCDVIEIVIQAVDISITNYIKEINQIVSIIPKNWSSQFEMHIKDLSSCVMKEIKRKQEEQDLKYKAYLRNYQIFYQNSQKILQQCDSLWEEAKNI